MNEEAQPKSVLRSILIAVSMAFASTIALVGTSYVIDGVTLATRSATFLVLPIGLIWVALLMSGIFCIARREFLAATLFFIGFILLGITANPYVASGFIDSVEMEQQTIQATRENPYRAVVVLGGGAGISPHGSEEINRDGERILSVAQLWHAGLVSSVICTGSAPHNSGHPRDIGKVLLVSVGVPTDVIYKIPGENTTLEMRSLKKFLNSPPEGFPESGDVALITSAYHIKRAMRLASVQELKLEPLPCGYRSSRYRGFSPHKLIPTAEAASAFGSALKERLGGLVGR